MKEITRSQGIALSCPHEVLCSAPMQQGLRIGVAQINSTIGDFPGNAKRILAAYRACLDQGADLVITPELSLVGYPPRDLIQKSQFVPKCLQALDYLSEETKDVPLLVGYVDFSHSAKPGRPYRNAAAWLEKGKIVRTWHKTLLPNYDVFDEQRYFAPSKSCEVHVWNGHRIGVTICEDIWNEDFLPRPLYDRNPVAEYATQGIDLLLNLSASPYHLGKPALRRKLMIDVARQVKAPVVYCNACAAQEELIFDGHSLIAAPTGEIQELTGFAEEVAVVDVAAPITTSTDDLAAAQVYQALVLGVRDYVQKCGFSSVCLGLSGGIDSALTAVIAADAIGAENVYGITMPSPYSSRGSVDDSFALAQALGISCQEIPIAQPFEAVKHALQPLFAGEKEDVTEENMQARLRGLYLMSFSNKFGHLLLTTGNKSEMAVGYCTIYGDMCGGLAVIGDLPKTLVYQVCEWINREREIIPWNTIRKAPSAELRPDQKDQDTLPPYEVLDAILHLLIEEQQDPIDVVAQGYEESLVLWIQRRIDTNEWKRQQAAPILRITSKAFGIGRRMPIVHRFQG